ncbi:hypothetical protein L873DRAFT_831711 [Choiromyces venosus 120613-1]|uniref:Uncharacterized protein n=1 Tax=Choiromyces venosus 120613-1 TaxID=1336337 RepID=A0A3N4K2L5_9PEZI|nr:hypothetical protein L873DRAFT_831711 [Choiromyces venosus 120613-1]
MDIWVAHKKEHFAHSIANSPNFYYSPFGSLLVTHPGMLLPINAYGNRSADSPQTGKLTKEILCDSFGVITQPNGQLAYKVGHEMIPNNWYHHAKNDFNLAAAFSGVVQIVIKIPQAASLGGNMGAVNSFVSADIVLTGGAFNFQRCELDGSIRVTMLCFEDYGSVLPEALGKTGF